MEENSKAAAGSLFLTRTKCAGASFGLMCIKQSWVLGRHISTRLKKDTFQITVKTAENKCASGHFIVKEWALFRGPFLFQICHCSIVGFKRILERGFIFPFWLQTYRLRSRTLCKRQMGRHSRYIYCHGIVPSAGTNNAGRPALQHTQQPVS